MVLVYADKLGEVLSEQPGLHPFIREKGLDPVLDEPIVYQSVSTLKAERTVGSVEATIYTEKGHDFSGRLRPHIARLGKIHGNILPIPYGRPRLGILGESRSVPEILSGGKRQSCFSAADWHNVRRALKGHAACHGGKVAHPLYPLEGIKGAIAHPSWDESCPEHG